MPKPLRLGTTVAGKEVSYPEHKPSVGRIHVVGSPGYGKSKLLEFLLRQDVKEEHGLCLIDPHGELFNDLVTWCVGRGYFGSRKIELIDLSAKEWTFGFNPLSVPSRDPDEIAFQVDTLIDALAQVWGGEDTTKTPRLVKWLFAVFQVLIEQDLTLLEALPLLASADEDGVRKQITAKIQNRAAEALWREADAMRAGEFREVVESSVSRLLQFIQTPAIERMFSQKTRTIDLRRIMDEGSVLLVNLAGVLSDKKQFLVGSLILSDLFAKAKRRPKGSRPFRVYIDECHEFMTDAMANIIVQGRKFGLRTVLAHQNLGQVRERSQAVQSAIMQSDTKIVFAGLSTPDAREMADEIFSGEHNLERPKESLKEWRVVGYDRGLLRSFSESVGRAKTTGSTWSASEAESSGTALGEFLTAIETATGEDASSSGASTVYVSASGSTASHGGMDAETATKSSTTGAQEALLPKLELRPGAVYSLEEMRELATAFLKNLPERFYVVKVGNGHSSFCRVPALHPGDAIRKEVTAATTTLYQLTDWVRPSSEVAREVEERLAGLKRAAKGCDDDESFWDTQKKRGKMKE